MSPTPRIIGRICEFHSIYLSACFEFNSDDSQKGFVTTSPDASHRQAARDKGILITNQGLSLDESCELDSPKSHVRILTLILETVNGEFLDCRVVFKSGKFVVSKSGMNFTSD